MVVVVVGEGWLGGMWGGEDRKQEEEFGTLGVAEVRGWENNQYASERR